ncbi:Retrovirus-related polyprotein from transposon [Salix suchowensis]|nr:Retrovirus-related polyprotein from transposon [Salix suchowensis]
MNTVIQFNLSNQPNHLCKSYMVSERSSPTRTEASFNSMTSIENSSVPTSASTLSLVTINTSSQLPYKLTSSNYPSWRATFLTILIGHDLMKYLDDTFPCPPSPALLLNAIFASVSEAVMPLIAMITTSRTAWQHLSCLFASKSRARIMQLKEDLTLIQRGTCTVSEFLHAVKAHADELSLIDAPVSDDDLTLYVLNGLGTEFRDMVAPSRKRNCSVFCRIT